MLNRIKEYFRKPQIGDIWYFQLSNPFTKPYRYLITDKKSGWVQLQPIIDNDRFKLLGKQEQTIQYLKQFFKREI